jgi:glucuronate isomerase
VELRLALFLIEGRYILGGAEAGYPCGQACKQELIGICGEPGEGCFQGGGIKGKIQMGSGWWFCDHKDGMEQQIKVLGNLGMIPAFVGMLTDSRSFLSYSRHEYFRRILCNIIGTWVENGEYPNDEKMLTKIVKDISFGNALSYFGA